MKKFQSSISIFVLFFILTLVFYSCTKEKLENMVITPESAESLKKDGIGTDAYAYCYTETTNWEFHHFAYKDGKYLGIWNTKPSFKSPNELHDKWGFYGYFISNETEKNNMISLGYSSTYLMVFVRLSNGNYSIPSGVFSKYYVDEPYEDGSLSFSKTFQLSEDISEINSGAELYLGSYKDNSPAYAWYGALLNAAPNTRMMCDQYYDGTILYGDDQRPYWTWFKNNYTSSRVKSHWIHILIDGIQGDFNMLFDHANGLGINMLWLYAGDATNSWPGISQKLTADKYNTYLTQFCSTAFSKGFLRKFEQKVTRYYRCQASDCNDCYENDTWEMYNKTYGEIREVYP